VSADTGARERLARFFHETYERLAPEFGYETRPESAVPWEQVPEQNRRLMEAVAGEALVAGVGVPPDAESGSALDHRTVEMRARAEAAAEHPGRYGASTIGYLAADVLALLNLSHTLARIVFNAESWHGPPPDDSGHVRALAVIAKWGRDALAGVGEACPAEPDTLNLGRSAGDSPSNPARKGNSHPGRPASSSLTGREPGQPQGGMCDCPDGGHNTGDGTCMCGGQIKKFTLEPAGQKVVELQAEFERLREELRIREESQIPVIPQAAKERLDRAESKVGRLREQLNARTQDISDTEKRWGETLAEYERLREQLDAAVNALKVIESGDSDDWWAREVARDALGVVGEIQAKD
jgi:hypothetical protein